MSVEIIAADWPAAGVIAGTTTRVGGVSVDRYASLNLAAHVGDSVAAVTENRRRLASALRLPREPRWLNQVHGVDVHVTQTTESDNDPPTADGVVSPDGRDVVAILTADCLPVVLCSSTQPEIAAAHCGWRGLAAGVIAETIAQMSSRPADIQVWLGPRISQAAFEVGDDVRDIFLAAVEDAIHCFDENEDGRWQADLAGLARLFLQAEGVEQVYDCNQCTHADPGRFYSYRRDGQCGRMATFAFRI